MVEIAKAAPVQADDMEDQVAVIWAATNGYLDATPVSAIHKYEVEFVQFLKSKYSSVVAGSARPQGTHGGNHGRFEEGRRGVQGTLLCQVSGQVLVCKKDPRRHR